MSQTQKMILSCVGVFIGGTGGYWQLHGDPGVLITTPAFWIGFVMAGLVPLGAYFVGLVSKAPWEGTTSPAGSTPAPGGSVSKLPLVLLCGLLLAGCAGPLQDFTVNDLRAAGARAVAGNDPVAAQCYPVLADRIAGEKAVGSVAGAVDLFEAGRLATMKVQSGLPAEVKAKCAELSLELLVFLAKLGLKIVAPIPTIGP